MLYYLIKVSRFKKTPDTHNKVNIQHFRLLVVFDSSDIIRSPYSFGFDEIGFNLKKILNFFKALFCKLDKKIQKDEKDEKVIERKDLLQQDQQQ